MDRVPSIKEGEGSELITMNLDVLHTYQKVSIWIQNLLKNLDKTLSCEAKPWASCRVVEIQRERRCLV